MSDGSTLDWALAVDIGGSKLAAARVRPDGSVQVRAQRPTPRHGVWDALAGLLDDVAAGETPAAVGVGCGGPMAWPDGVVSPLNIPEWRAFPLRSRLRERWPQAVVRVHNDAVAMTAGEHWRGAAQGRSNVLGIVVSTGVGGGLVIDGRLVSGRTGNAGHLGHVVVDVDGPRCACGGYGCLEAIARGPAVLAWARGEGWTGDVTDGPALVADARRGDAVCLAALTRAGRALGVAVASGVALLDLDVVVVGGGLANAGELLLGPARTAYRRHAQLDFVRDVRMVPAALGGDAGLVGAAAFVLEPGCYWPSEAD